MLGGTIPSLFGGAMITESVYALEGIGYTAYKAVLQADVPFVMGYNMFIAVLTVLGILISDILYMVVDPRVKLK
jgi:peptide/nickel transport system permease protein